MNNMSLGQNHVTAGDYEEVVRRENSEGKKQRFRSEVQDRLVANYFAMDGESEDVAMMRWIGNPKDIDTMASKFKDEYEAVGEPISFDDDELQRFVGQIAKKMSLKPNNAGEVN